MKAKLLGLLIVAMFIVSSISLINNDYQLENDVNTPQEYINNSKIEPKLDRVQEYTETGNYYPENWSFIEFLRDNPNEYSKIWEPWLTKAAIHAIATNDNGTMIAIGGGYLYDNEIHIFHWNYEKNTYEKVWDSGNNIIRGDIISLAFGDTDNNRLHELVAASADGHIYVFEQRHVFDPITNTEHMYDLVWKSPYLGPVWTVKVFDADLDYIPDIIVGSLNGSLMLFEYRDHSGYPFSQEHWISYDVVWSYNFGSAVYSIEVGDTNGNELPNIVVGLRNGEIVVLENNGTVIPTGSSFIALPNDNEYRVEWVYNYSTYMPILDMSIGDPDNDDYQEVAIVEWGREGYVLDYESSLDTYFLRKLYYPPRYFEYGEHPVDYWADWMIEGQNVFFDNGTYVFEEPIENYLEDTGIRFNNTAMGGPEDGKYSMFIPNETHEAIALIDFGIQEEIAGDGTPSFDVYVKFMIVSGFDYVPNSSAIRFYVSQDGNKFIEVTNYSTFVYTSSGYAKTYFDVDLILKENGWNRIRYMKIVVYYNHKFAIDAIRTYNIDKQLSDVSSCYISNLGLFGTSDYIIFGTVTGKIVVFGYNESTNNYEMFYDSFYEDRYLLHTNIWDISRVMKDTRFPYWLRGTSYIIKDLPAMTDYQYIDVDGDGQRDLLIANKAGGILYYRFNGTGFERDTGAEEVLFNDSGGINVYPTIKENLTFELADILDSTPGRELIVSFYTGTNYRIHIMSLSNPFDYPYRLERSEDLRDCESTGTLYGIYKYQGLDSPVTMDTGDLDGDGDTDIVLAINGKLYVLWNIKDTWPDPIFKMDTEYFRDINEDVEFKRATHPQLVDFNGDGILDIVISFEKRNGSTYYENIGLADNPIWVEKKQLFANSLGNTNSTTNFALEGYTLTSVFEDDGYHILAWKRNTNELRVFDGDSSAVETIALATYPLLTIINFAPLTVDGKPNFGYHLLEVWSNNRELYGWTQAIAFGDMDGDGKKEVVVGDYDNNVYVFEHLINNTYKIAYKTGDLYYEILTNQSPYYSEYLEGVDKTFKRRIWEHARFLAADTDIDHNGKKEFIVATHYQILIFEHQMYENYELVYNYSFLDHPLGDVLLEYTDGITAFAYAGDMDYDGYGEVVVALGAYLFVLEMTPDGFMETYNFHTYDLEQKLSDYMSYHGYYIMEPTFPLAGNPYTGTYKSLKWMTANYSGIKIYGLLVADFDKNGDKEIIIGGSNESLQCKCLWDGILISLENNLGTYYIKWVAPESITFRNPIKDLSIGDMDFDGKEELFVAGEKGVDVFEHTTTSYLSYLTSITRNPDHPFYGNKAVFNSSPYGYDNYRFLDQDIVIFPDGSLFLLFITDYNISSPDFQVYYTISHDNGNTWSYPSPLTSSGDYGSLTPVNETIVRGIWDGHRVLIAWYATVDIGGSLNYSICVRYYNASDGSLSPIRMIKNSTADSISDLSLWDYSAITGSFPWYFTYDLGLSYINTTDESIYLYTRRWFLGYEGWVPHPWTQKISFVYNSSVWHGFLEHDITRSGDNYSIVFVSEYGDSYGRRLFWVSHSDYKMENWSKPTIVLDTFMPLYSPSIEYYSKDSTFVVGGVIYGDPLGPRPFIVTSTNGYSWSQPRLPYWYHPRVKEICDEGVLTRKLFLRSTYYPISTHETYQFRLSINANGEIAYSGTIDIVYDPFGLTDHLYDIIVYKTRNADWLINELESTTDIAVGDTDGDSRLEVIAGYSGKVGIFEIRNNTEASRSYIQKSTLLVNCSVQDVGIGDANGNGWNDIVVAGEFGNVFSFEFVNPTWRSASLQYPKEDGLRSELSSVDITYYGVVQLDSDSGLEYYFDDGLNDLYVYDYISDSLLHITMPGIVRVDAFVGSDGYYDFVVALNNGTVVILDGADLSVLGSRTPYPGSSITDMYVVDGRIFTTNSSGYIYGLWLTNLSIFFEYSSGISNSRLIRCIMGPSGIHAVIIQNSGGIISALSYPDGSVLWSVSASLTASRDLFIADNNDDGFDDIVAANYSSGYNLLLISGFDGTIMEELEYVSPQYYVRFVSANLDNDSYEDFIALTSNGIVAVSMKTFDAVWYTTNYKVSNVFATDIDGDSISELSFSMIGGGVLANSYGLPTLYYGDSSQETFFLHGDIDLDGKTELFGFLENGTFIVAEPTTLSVEVSGVAYYKPRDIGIFTAFKNVDYSVMTSGDLDADGDEEIIVSNGTHLLVSTVKGDIFYISKLPLTPREIFTMDSKGNGKITNLIVYNDSAVGVLDDRGRVERIWSFNPDKIVRVFVGKFNDKYIDTILVVTTGKTYIIDGNNMYDILTGGLVYPIVADFDGDGIWECALKFLYPTPIINVYDDDGSLKWTKTLTSNSTYQNTFDIFALDVDGNGKYEIAFADDSGYINIYDGTTGSILYTIKTGIKSYALSIMVDTIFGSGALAVKYAYHGFYVFSTAGSKLIEFKDQSYAKYTRIETDNYGTIYIAHLTGKFIGITKNFVIYAKLSKETICYTTTNSFGTNETVALLSDGRIATIFYEELATQQIRTEHKNNTTPRTIPLTPEIAAVLILICIIVISIKKKK